MSNKCIGKNCLLNQKVTIQGAAHRLIMSTKLDDQFGTIRGLVDAAGVSLDLNQSNNRKLLDDPALERGLVRALDSAYSLASKSGMLSEVQDAANKAGTSFAYDGNTIARLSANLGKSEYDASQVIPSFQAKNFLHPDAAYNGDVAPIPAVPSNLEEAAAQVFTSTKNKPPKFFQYPVDAIYLEDGLGAQDYMKIERFEYSAPNASVAADLSKIFTDGLTRSVQTRKFIGSVRLPIPNDLQTSQGMNWGQGTANIVEAGTFMTARDEISKTFSKQQNVFDLIRNGLQNITKVGQTFANEVQTAGGDVNTAISGQIAKILLSKVNINVDPAQFIARKNGQVLNPNMELLFSGPKLRQFVFKYEFAPNNEEDAKQANSISKFFKEGMTPLKTGTGIFIGSPDIFRISYFNGQERIRALPIHKMCALTNIGFNYTDGGVYQSYADPKSISQPVRTTMMLSFTELTPIFRDDYKLGENRTASTEDLIRFQGPLMGTNKITEEDIGF